MDKNEHYRLLQELEAHRQELIDVANEMVNKLRRSMPARSRNKAISVMQTIRVRPVVWIAAAFVAGATLGGVIQKATAR